MLLLPGEREPSVEKMQPSDWPLGKSGGHGISLTNDKYESALLTAILGWVVMGYIIKETE